MSRTIYSLIATTSLTLLVAGCSSIQKNQALTDAELAYAEAKQNEQILRYAPAELERANQALTRAATAENHEDMTSLAYVGKTRTSIAQSVAARKAAAAKLEELGKIKNKERLKAREIEIQLEQQAKDEALREKEAALMERENALAKAEALRRELEALQATKTERGMVMTLGDVLFSTGKTALLPGAMSTIGKLADFLAEYPEKTVLVEGHTDNVGSDAYNQDLSERRALSVKEALIQAGVDGSRIDTTGLGETQPITDNSTDAGRLKNRRVEIVIRD
ncbi:MAG: OmpA family protein [Candidatus Thiodiazotropha sp. (ex Dulcina madagascariensis)]|nr:OmpA family protein [Candidatus Thiodiazotropha sp. (ex Dulcina madagascariensis)]MCU7925650.1 OmpA family protein [Candidatus Thiodiazotropha sp. (ex Dulcina madagascariensis)]